MATWTMPIDKILELESCETSESMRYTIDFMDWCGPDLRQDRTSGYYARLRERMREEGINKVPILVEDGYLCNGHHRVTLAYELGLPEMLCTDDFEESGYSPNLIGVIL